MVTAVAAGTRGVEFYVKCKPVDLQFGSLSEEDEEDPGAILPINDDDDNHNGDYDRHEGGPLPQEDDLVALTLTAEAGPSDTVTLSATSSSCVRVYENADKTGRFLLPKTWPVESMPEHVYVEGYSPGEPTLRLGYTTGWSCPDKVKLRVVKVERLVWDEKLDSGNLGLDTCPNNGGRRIFPGKLSPGDQDASTRRQVDLVATIVPRVPDVLVYFNVWDVDDPFDRIMLGMPNVELIDNDTTGPDNRLNHELPQLYSDFTDEDGKARVTITVSMQPGNNYRAAASCVGDVFAATAPDTPQADQTDADAKYYYHSSTWSGYEVPAVWRDSQCRCWGRWRDYVGSLYAKAL